ncbi:dinitrogenase iron-molybdenum cofactor biosynthesis protein [Methanofollis formosanus]|uniref:Dinitrogenase iron-molybdenum cofactor biosynthesis protein n=1 Tax=Methanofollis formosanus TaxID=299308 RepID=A0A8G1EGZ1_9EURY|nr:NifB/NifX family molybdenum-iron cluster-binding protein [Methanofollis formosanus]QYZ79427.1 dinitrogenase iron-molybdenum cofactor biosynthesis protein [Methanofollis formosanus]
MKLAIAQDGEIVSAHFGHCESYAIFEVEDGNLARQADLLSPGHEPGRLPAFLAENDVKAVIAGGMGPRAVDLFHMNGIEVFLGIAGEIDAVAAAYAAGDLASGESTCTHGEEGHENCEGHE